MSFAFSVQEESVQEEEQLPPARQNPILRAYFRRQFANMRSFRTSQRGERRDPFLEDYIDRQIDHYLSELAEKLYDLNRHFDHVVQAHEAVLHGPSPQAVDSARTQWRNALKRVQDDAGDLWNMLRYVLTALEDKGKLPPVASQGPDSLYEKETRFIGEQIKEAEKRITEYFFDVESVIELEDLKGENMLIHLHLAREMAKEIRDLTR